MLSEISLVLLCFKCDTFLGKHWKLSFAVEFTQAEDQEGSRPMVLGGYPGKIHTSCEESTGFHAPYCQLFREKNDHNATNDGVELDR